MDEISQNPPALHQENVSKNRVKPRPRRRVASLLSLVWWAFCNCLVGLFCFRPAPAPTISAETLTGGQPAITRRSWRSRFRISRLSREQLDERAPITDRMTANRLATGPESLREIYQATLLASQGGRIKPVTRHIATIAGVSVRTVQLRMLDLEALELTKRRYHRIRRAWRGPKGQNYRTYNEPNSYSFPLLERQLRFNFTPSRKNLNTKANTPNNPCFEAEARRRERPDDHPAAFRAAVEARHRANHPPEMRRRYEEKAAWYEEMRGWRPKLGKNAAIMHRVRESMVGSGGDLPEREYIPAFYDACERQGMNPKTRKRKEAAEMIGADERDQARAAERERNRRESEEWLDRVSPGWRDQVNYPPLRVELAEPVSNAELALDLPPQPPPRPKKFLLAEGQGSEQKAKNLEVSQEPAPAISTGEKCERCDGKKFVVIRGPILVCPVCKGKGTI